VCDSVVAEVLIRLRCLIRSSCNYLQMFRRALLCPSSGRTITNLVKLNDNLLILSSALILTFNFFSALIHFYTLFFATEVTWMSFALGFYTVFAT